MCWNLIAHTQMYSRESKNRIQTSESKNRLIFQEQQELQQITTKPKRNSKIGQKKLIMLQLIAPKSRDNWQMRQLNGAEFQNQFRGNRSAQSGQSGRSNQSMKCDEMERIRVQNQQNSDKI